MTNHDVTLYMDVFFLCFQRVLRATLFQVSLYPFVSVTYVFTRLSIYSLILYIGCVSFLECIFEILYLWSENESFDFFLLYYCYYFPLLMVLYLSIFGALGIFFFFFFHYIGKILLCNNFIIISQCVQCLVSLKNYLIKFYLMCFFLLFFYYYSSCIR